MTTIAKCLYFIVIILGQYIVQGLCKDHTVSQYPF